MKGDDHELTSSTHGLNIRACNRIARGWSLSEDRRSYISEYRGTALRVEADRVGYRAFVNDEPRMLCDNPFEAMKFAQDIVRDEEWSDNAQDDESSRQSA